MHRRMHLVTSILAVAAGTLLTPAAEAKIIATQKKSTPRPGVTLLEGTTRAPKSNYYAAKISLCQKGIRVDATPPATSFKTVPAFAKASGADLAVNGDFFKPGPRVQGIAVGGGKPWPLGKTGVDPAVANEWYHERFGWIAFGPDFVTFTHTGWVKKRAAELGVTQGYSPAKITHDFPKGTVALVSGFPELVTEGKVYTCTSPTASSCFPDRSDMRARHPRTAMGLSKDMRTFILAVVDGRSSTSAGMYGPSSPSSCRSSARGRRSTSTAAARARCGSRAAGRSTPRRTAARAPSRTTGACSRARATRPTVCR